MTLQREKSECTATHRSHREHRTVGLMNVLCAGVLLLFCLGHRPWSRGPSANVYACSHRKLGGLGGVRSRPADWEAPCRNRRARDRHPGEFSSGFGNSTANHQLSAKPDPSMRVDRFGGSGTLGIRVRLWRPPRCSTDVPETDEEPEYWFKYAPRSASSETSAIWTRSRPSLA